MTATFEESVSSLRAIFPHINPDVIKNVLLSQHGNMEHAAAVLVTEKPAEKTSMRDLSCFELRKVLLSVDRKVAEMFYAHRIDGETFVSLTSEQCRRYGCPLNPYRLATLKKEAKKALLDHDSAPEMYNRSGVSGRTVDTDDEKEFELGGDANMVYCVTVPTMVREDYMMDSEPVGGLSPGTAVTVEEIVGLRVRISEPLEGWISSQAQNGIRILLQMKQEDLDHLLAQELQNPELYKAHVEEDQYFPDHGVYQYGRDDDDDDDEEVEAAEVNPPKKGFFSKVKGFFKSKPATKFDFGDNDNVAHDVKADG